MCRSIVVIPEHGKFELKLRLPKADGKYTCDVCSACVNGACTVARVFDCSEYDQKDGELKVAYLKRV